MDFLGFGGQKGRFVTLPSVVSAVDMRSYEAGQDQKWKNKRDNESGGNHKESTGKKVEVVWACDEKRGTIPLGLGYGLG